MRNASLIFALFCASPLFAGSADYWYNGDSDNFGTLVNEVGGDLGTGFIYDDFVVGASGVNITGVFSNDIVYTNPPQGASTNAPGVVTTADWQILSGVSSGNGGTVVASGSGATATQTLTTQTATPYAVYDILVSGLNINLAPGAYWLAVAPDISSSYSAHIVTTYGFNGVGTPQAKDGSSFFNDSFFSADFEAASDFTGPDPADGTNNVDFSMGVIGTASATPEPGTLALSAGAMLLLGLAAAARRLLI